MRLALAPKVAVAEEDTAVVGADKVVAEEDTAVAGADKVAAEADTAVTGADKVVAEEDMAVAEVDKVAAEVDEGVADEDQRVAVASNHRHSTSAIYSRSTLSPKLGAISNESKVFEVLKNL